MDPIAAATNAVPLEPQRPVEPPRDAAAAAEPTASPASAAAQSSLSDEQLAAYKDTAAAFVGQMYLTLWREAQRNSG